ncbi:MAG TPA: MEDS domain-containing protein [Bacteroidia bacterium]|nr:MEDS domain-containing protein [Bacteroidia bacterium]
MEKINQGVENWERSNVRVFWGEVAPCEHVVQLYESDKEVLDTLEAFIIDGLQRDECVLIMATQGHLSELELRLIARGLKLPDLLEDNQYIPLNAEECLNKFIVSGWPNEKLFFSFIESVMTRTGNRKVRAFGEMVAVLWAQGKSGATVQLENLWHKLHTLNKFCLYCAYPKIGFTQNFNDSIHQICKCHSKVIRTNEFPATEIYFKSA